MFGECVFVCRCLLFVDWCSLVFVVCCSLICVRRSVFIVRGVRFVVASAYRLLIVVCLLLLNGVRCVLIVMCCC